MATEIWVNIGSGNGLLPDGTKPLPEPMLTYHHWSLVAFTWEQFHMKCSRYLPLIWVWKLLIWDCIHISQGPMSFKVIQASGMDGVLSHGTRHCGVDILWHFIYNHIQLDSREVIKRHIFIALKYITALCQATFIFQSIMIYKHN